METRAAAKESPWADLFALVAGAATIIDLLLGKSTEILAAVFPQYGGAVAWCIRGGLILVLFAYLWTKVAAHRAPTIVKPELLARPYQASDGLPGRSKEIEHLVASVRKLDVLHVTGESGVGKSTLLKHGLRVAPEISSSYRCVFIDDRSWHLDPLRELALALGLNPTGNAPLRERLAEYFRSSERTHVLLIDHLETFIEAHFSELKRTRLGTWISPKLLARRFPFWGLIAELIREKRIRVVTATRSESGDALSTFSFGLTSVYPLMRLPATLLPVVLGSLEANGLLDNPENAEWVAFKSALEEDLSESNTLLPVRMSVVLRGIPTLKPLTVRSYVRRGGVQGLEAAVLLTTIDQVSHAAGLDRGVLTGALVGLVDPVKIATRVCAASTLLDFVRAEAPTLSSTAAVDTPRLERALQLLEMENIVRRQGRGADMAPLWALHHSYLSRGILAAHANTMGVPARIERRRKSFYESQSIAKRYSAVFGVRESIALLRESAEKKVDLRPYAGFLSLTGLKIVPAVILLMSPLILADAGVSFPGSNRIRYALVGSGVSLLSPMYDEREIRESASKLRASLMEALGGRALQNDWFTTSLDGAAAFDRDYWAHAQTVAALVKDRAGLAPRDAVRKLDAMFSQTATDSHGRKVGWEQGSAGGYARAEPLLWTGMGLALLRRRAADLKPEQIALVSQRLSEVLVMTHEYFDPDSGAWRRFSGQRSAGTSPYVAALGLAMMLDARAVDPSLQVAGVSIDTAVQKTVRWLLDKYEWNREVPGWTEPTGKQFSENLTIQIYAALARAAQELPGPVMSVITQADLRQIRKNISQQVRRFYREAGHTEVESASIQEQITNLAGQPFTTDATIRFSRTPWRIAMLAWALKRACQYEWSLADYREARQQLGEIVVAQGSEIMNATIKPKSFAFPAAELYFALAELELALPARYSCDVESN